MHLGNSIICPVTGIPMILAMGTAVFFAFKKSRNDFDKKNIPLYITLTAFVFALQMINFAIPSTGSSGHVIGTILLCALLSPSLAFLSMSLILIVQALFFADGGLTAIGCNIFNMAFIPCFIVYPLLFKPLKEKNHELSACLISSVAALELGSIAVIIETTLSGSITGNLSNFLSLMMFIHLLIGIVEGFLTSFIVILTKNQWFNKASSYIFAIFAVILAGLISNYASNKPDGLEWALLNISDSITYQTQGIIYSISEAIQAKTAVLTKINPFIANILGLLIVSASAVLVTIKGKINAK